MRNQRQFSGRLSRRAAIGAFVAAIPAGIVVGVVGSSLAQSPRAGTVEVATVDAAQSLRRAVHERESKGLRDQRASSIVKTIQIDPRTHDHVSAIEICDLPPGSWRYGLETPAPMRIHVGGRVEEVNVANRSPRGWALVLNGAHPGDRVLISKSGCARLQTDMPAVLRPRLARGEYRIAEPMRLVLSLD